MRKGEILEVIEVRPMTVADVLAGSPPVPEPEVDPPERSRRTVRA